MKRTFKLILAVLFIVASCISCYAKSSQGKSSNTNDLVYSAAKTTLQNVAKDPGSIQVYRQGILETMVHNDKTYYLVQMDASGTNSFGGRIRNWYIVEVIIGNDGRKYTRNNVQSFDYKPTSTQISLCKALFGWN
jgi:hypothetical protein